MTRGRGRTPGATAADEPLLVVQQVSRRFGGVRALDAVNMQTLAGTVHGLIGPNGAGKTTLVNVLTGFDRPTTGRIFLRGTRLDGQPPFRIARRGVARTFQNIRLFRGMSALDNVLVARRRYAARRTLGRLLFLPTTRALDHAERQIATHLLQSLGVDPGDPRPAGGLAYGDQRRVEIARALAVEPCVLVLDEPAAGMNREETDRLGALIRSLAGPDRAILLIEHDLPLIMTVCDHVTVLNFGRVIAEGAPVEIAAHPAVIEAYLGSETDDAGL
jgi:branched-chain amino acid transport system ATP-binding protein